MASFRSLNGGSYAKRSLAGLKNGKNKYAFNRARIDAERGRHNAIVVNAGKKKGPVVARVASTTALVSIAAALAARADEVAAEVSKNDGWFGKIVSGVETGILGIDQFLQNQGIEQSTGVAIILFTILVRTLVLPLNFASLKSNSMMQAIQPRMKEIQTKFKDDQETQGALILQLYQKAGINPLAGLIPAFAQIPVFLAFYRALSNLAKDDKLSSPFLWLPSLEGPTFSEQNLNWITKGWVGLTPPLGWHDTLAYLSLPVLYVIGNSLSQKLLAPPTPAGDDGAAATTNAFTNFLPLLIGYFSLNVPSALLLYWTVSSLYSVGSTVVTRAVISKDPKVLELKELMSAPMVVEDAPPSPFNPPSSTDSTEPIAPAPFSSATPTIETSSRSDRGARFRALKAKEAGEEVEVADTSSATAYARGTRFRALKESETETAKED
eukprot:CAMPEP_0167759966 /NCGR_PEP_ID=MMETSP0110_2-20121227/11321_1 /TAXON_ID=629695 /ORGANISM="Gymnochlora sp., Strain CCMP2014" /LENGTH=437 /DNA_ID=CAMNT_0007646419 /DNA_START=93 /DNA_END=1406 /DNA_ORIENTATION=-